MDGRATEAEQAVLLDWLHIKENRIVFKSYKLDWENNLDHRFRDRESLESWNKIQAEIFNKSLLKWQQTQKVSKIFKYAAIFCFVVSIVGSVMYFTGNSVPEPQLYYESYGRKRAHLQN